MDGRIIIKVEDGLHNILACFYIQKWFQNFIKDLWISLKCKDRPPWHTTSMNTITYKNNQMQKLETKKFVEITWNPKQQERDECKYMFHN